MAQGIRRRGATIAPAAANLPACSSWASYGNSQRFLHHHPLFARRVGRDGQRHISITLAVGFALGVTMAVLRVYGSRPLTAAAAVYSVVVRAVPVVVTIFILYFVIAEFIDLSPFLAGALALGFASGAYQSEIFRGALQSVAPGQMTSGAGNRHEPAASHPPHRAAAGCPPGAAGRAAATLVLKDSTLVIAVGVPEMRRPVCRCQPAQAVGLWHGSTAVFVADDDHQLRAPDALSNVTAC